MINELSEIEIKKIKNYAREKLGSCRKSNDIIGTQIFSILSLYARVIYYPLGENAPWGFTRISGSKDVSSLDKPFVAINTSIPIDCQVFAAAHELYHIWFEQEPDILPADLLDDQKKELNEKKANRFAAEFLVDEQLLKQEIDIYNITDFNIKDILQLASLFSVPYRTMVKRLNETSIIPSSRTKQFLLVEDETIEQYKKRYSLTSVGTVEHISMDNLVELAAKAYEKELITYEKLEYLLEICKLTPKDLGIDKKSTYSFLSDSEIDNIMED